MKILLAGGTGMIGSAIAYKLRQKGHEVAILSRRRGVKWDPAKRYLPENALDGVDCIMNLAGAGIADKRWTSNRKKEIIDSRVNSTGLLAQALQERKHQVKSFINASAVGFYGSGGDDVLKEDTGLGDDFLAEVTKVWEEAAQPSIDAGVRTVFLRIGIVLSFEGGALKEMAKTVPFGIAGVIGNGKQYYPIIHVDDVASMFVFSMESDNVSGAYNAAGPNPVRLKELMKAIIKASGKNAILVPAPEFAIKLVLGELSNAVLKSSNVSSEKIAKAGFKWQFPTTESMLEDLYNN